MYGVKGDNIPLRTKRAREVDLVKNILKNMKDEEENISERELEEVIRLGKYENEVA